MDAERLRPLNELKNFADRHKDISRLDLSLSNYAFDVNVLWCRFAHDERWSAVSHRHSFYEVHFCTSGFAKFSNSQGEVIPLQPGTFVIFPPEQEHLLSFHSDNFEKMVFAFSLELKPSADYPFLSGAYHNIPFDGFEASDKLIRYARQLCEEACNNHFAYKLVVSDLLSTFIVGIARIITPNHGNRRASYKKRDNRLDILILFMKDNLSHRLTSEDFAAEANMSVKQLNRLMKQTYHMSVADFFRKERIERAKHLLSHTSYNTAYIAQEVGFCDEFSFNKAFKRMEGITPGIFRSSFASQQNESEPSAESVSE